METHEAHGHQGRPPGRPLQSCLLYVPSTNSGIPFLATKLPLWKKALAKQGADITQDSKAPGITHVLLGQDTRSPPLELQRQGVFVVSNAWLESCLAQRRRLPEADFQPPSPPPAKPLKRAAGFNSAGASSEEEDPGGSSGGGSAAHRRWLGAEYWRPGCEAMSQTELCLQAVYVRYDEGRSRALGNEPLVQALIELRRYEEALHPDYFSEETSAGEERKINHRALRYAKVAGAVRACSYRITPPVRAGQLPFVGDASAQQMTDILATGSCAALDSFRADVEVRDSRGRLRRDSIGGRTRAAFHALPGVGQRTAKRWWDLGLRSYEDVELVMRQAGGALAPDGAAPASVEQQFSVLHRADLLGGTSAEEVAEMDCVVREGLAAVAGPGWVVELVGGGRRSSASHDADFLATHPELPTEGVVPLLYEWLVAQGRLLPPVEAMCRIQTGLMPGHIQKLKATALHEESAAPSVQTLDRFDHIYGIYRTYRGKYLRLDVILAPPDEWAVAQVGWIGSRTYLRHMRQHAKDLGMWATSHRLFRKVGGAAYIVPDEAAPLGPGGQEQWPAGWAHGRRIESQQDVFELLGIPYREEHERNCP